jgi:hypothetical protein
MRQVIKCKKSIFYGDLDRKLGGINQRRAVPTSERLKGFPVQAVVFDLLYVEGQPLVGRPYSERLAFLSSKFSGFQNNHFKVVQNIQNPKQYWTDKIVKENREGLVLKDPKAPYSCGQRMNCQLKLKYYKRKNVIVEALETNPKGVKIIGTTADGIKGEIQWSSMGCENIKVGDSVEVEYLDVVNDKMVQPHKVKDSFINKH